MESKPIEHTSADAPGKVELSEREREILKLVATGASNKHIAQQLVISTNTVKVHLRNIFGKIGVASRTEAALYAIREGLVQVAEAMPGIIEAEQTAPLEADPAHVFGAGPRLPDGGPYQAAAAAPAAPAQPAWQARQVVWLFLLIGALFGIGSLVYWRPKWPGIQTTGQVPPPTPLPRWQVKSSMPTARSGLAVATYENQIYAIGGETVEGVTGTVERYDAVPGTWTVLAAKPMAVADVSAGVIGGLIYVPGGRLASGQVADVLEVYDPRRDHWERRAPLPVALSGYALAVFEGRLYVFGGWDGRAYLASVYEYDPAQDEWEERTRMPTARGFAGAAITTSRIYVIGGFDGADFIAANEEYVPSAEGEDEGPWRARASLPEGRAKFGVTSIVNIVHIVGGVGERGPSSPLKYLPPTDEWREFEIPQDGKWIGLGMAVVETSVYALGGENEIGPSSRNLAYQAIYTVSIPGVVP